MWCACVHVSLIKVDMGQTAWGRHLCVKGTEWRDGFTEWRDGFLILFVSSLITSSMRVCACVWVLFVWLLEWIMNVYTECDTFWEILLCVHEHCMHKRVHGRVLSDPIWQSALWTEPSNRQGLCVCACAWENKQIDYREPIFPICKWEKFFDKNKTGEEEL